MLRTRNWPYSDPGWRKRRSSSWELPLLAVIEKPVGNKISGGFLGGLNGLADHWAGPSTETFLATLRKGMAQNSHSSCKGHCNPNKWCRHMNRVFPCPLTGCWLHLWLMASRVRREHLWYGPVSTAMSRNSMHCWAETAPGSLLVYGNPTPLTLGCFI